MPSADACIAGRPKGPLRPIRSGGARGERCRVGVRSILGAAPRVTAARGPEPLVDPLDSVAAWRRALSAQAGRRATGPPAMPLLELGGGAFPVTRVPAVGQLAAPPFQKPGRGRPDVSAPHASVTRRSRFKAAKNAGRPPLRSLPPGLAWRRHAWMRPSRPWGDQRRTRVVRRRTEARIRAYPEPALRDS